MDKHFRFVFFAFLGVALFLSIPNIQSVFAQNSATSNCVLTDVGNPDPKQPLPPGCAGGGTASVVELAKAHLNGTYVWGAPPQRGSQTRTDDPNAGAAPTQFDCSGFAYWAWYWGTGGKVKLTGNTSAVWDGSGPWQKFATTDMSQLQPADLVYFGSPVHHVGIYEGAGACGSAHCFLEYYTTGLPGRENQLEKEPDYVGFVRPNLN